LQQGFVLRAYPQKRGFHIVLRKTVGIMLLVGGLYLYATHLFEHQWTDPHFLIGAIIALLGLWIMLPVSRTKKG
jgi:multisubunit Na+/H+ antiporter MnhG subunit